MINILFWNVVLAAAMAVGIKLCASTTYLRRRPAVLHLLWLLVLVKLISPPLIPIPLLPAIASNDSDRDIHTAAVAGDGSRPLEETPEYANHNSSTLPNGALGTAGDLGTDDSRSTIVPGSPYAQLGESYAAWVFYAIACAGAVFLLARLASCIARLQRSVSLSRPSPELTELGHQVGGELGCRRVPEVCVVEAAIAPALVGWSPSRIVIPQRILDALTKEELREVLAHEIAHDSRRDQFVFLAASVIRALMWWNPVAWWACHEIRLAQELSCDALVVSRSQGMASRYAEAIWKVANLLSDTRQSLEPAIAMSTSSVRFLTKRFEMMTDKQLSATIKRSSLGLGAILLLVCVSFPVAQNAIAQQSKTSDARTKQPKPENNAAEKKALGQLSKQEKVDRITAAEAAMKKSIRAAIGTYSYELRDRTKGSKHPVLASAQVELYFDQNRYCLDCDWKRRMIRPYYRGPDGKRALGDYVDWGPERTLIFADPSRAEVITFSDRIKPTGCRIDIFVAKDSAPFPPLKYAMQLAGFENLRAPLFLYENDSSLALVVENLGLEALTFPMPGDAALRVEYAIQNSPKNQVSLDFDEDLQLLATSIRNPDLGGEYVRRSLKWSKEAPVAVPIQFRSLQPRGDETHEMIYKRIDGKLNIEVDAKYFDKKRLMIPDATRTVQHR